MGNQAVQAVSEQESEQTKNTDLFSHLQEQQHGFYTNNVRYAKIAIPDNDPTPDLNSNYQRYRQGQFYYVAETNDEKNENTYLTEWQQLVLAHCLKSDKNDKNDKNNKHKNKNKNNNNNNNNQKISKTIYAECETTMLDFYNKILILFRDEYGMIEDIIINEIFEFSDIVKNIEITPKLLNKHVSDIAVTSDVRGGGTGREFAPNLLWKHSKWFSVNRGPWKINYQFNTSVVIDKYQVMSANDVPARDPSCWIIAGLPDGCNNDDKNWVILHEVKSQVFGKRHEMKEYKIDENIAKKYFHGFKRYSMVIKEAKSGHCQMGRLSFFGFAMKK